MSNVENYIEQGGARTVIGGELDVVGGDLKLEGTAVTATAAELNAIDGAIASVTTVATPATGSVGVQFTFKDAAGVAVAAPRTFLCYLSDSAGATHPTAVSSLAVLTNGALTSLVTGKVALVTTSTAGLLGITLTGSAAAYRLAFTLPNGKVIVSDSLTVN